MLVNLTRGTIVCQHVVIADTARRRMRGLLGRQSLPSGEGILLCPAPSIHTAFMKFPIDVVFLAGTLRVQKVVEDLGPWRMSSSHNAWAVLEIAAGEVQRREIEVGDQLGLVEVNDKVAAVVTALENSRYGRHREDLDLPGIERVDALDEAIIESERTRVLIVGSDRRFRSVAAALLGRRGCTVLLGDRITDTADLARRVGADVVVIDAGQSPASGARAAEDVHSLDEHVGVVIVADSPEFVTTAPVLAKWGSFNQLYEAIATARPAGAKEGLRRVRR